MNEDKEALVTWCDLCGYNVTKEDVDGRCPYWDCPMKNRIVDSAQTCAKETNE